MGAYQFGVDGARSHQNRKDPASPAGIEKLVSRSDYPPVDVTPHPAARKSDLQPTSGAAFGHLLLRVGDGALEGLDVVAFCFADDFLDGAGHGGFDFAGR